MGGTDRILIPTERVHFPCPNYVFISQQFLRKTQGRLPAKNFQNDALPRVLTGTSPKTPPPPDILLDPPLDVAPADRAAVACKVACMCVCVCVCVCGKTGAAGRRCVVTVPVSVPCRVAPCSQTMCGSEWCFRPLRSSRGRARNATRLDTAAERAIWDKEINTGQSPAHNGLQRGV